MRRSFASVLLLVLAVVQLAPLVVLLQFHVDRAHIERDLCVQRARMAEMRTCHGECQLSKRFRALEHHAEQEFPMKRIESRFEPLAPVLDEHRWFANEPFFVLRPDRSMGPLDRTVPTAEPVPWA